MYARAIIEILRYKTRIAKYTIDGISREFFVEIFDINRINTFPLSHPTPPHHGSFARSYIYRVYVQFCSNCLSPVKPAVNTIAAVHGCYSNGWLRAKNSFDSWTNLKSGSETACYYGPDVCITPESPIKNTFMT